MNKKPFVSILSSVYNCRSYIEQTVHSVLNQTYKDWEWIIVDDGSTDGTGDIIKDLKDRRIHYLFQEHTPSNHIAKNFNKILMITKGNLVAIIDGDDYWPHYKLQTQVEVFHDPEIILSYGECYLINHRGKKVRYVNLPDDLNIANNNPTGSSLKKLLLEKSCFMVNPTIMLRKDALLKIGGFLEVKGMGHDFPTWLRLALEGRFSAIPICLGYYRKHASSMSFNQNHEDTFNNEINFLSKFILEYGKELSCLGFLYETEKLKKQWEEIRMYIPFNSAMYMLMLGSFEDARSEFKKFLAKVPSIKNNLIYSLIVISSFLRIDLVNPLIYFKEKMKSQVKRTL